MLLYKEKNVIIQREQTYPKTKLSFLKLIIKRVRIKKRKNKTILKHI